MLNYWHTNSQYSNIISIFNILENLVKIEDYQNIEKYFKEFYPEIYNVDNFEIRHEIYNLEANLRLLPRFPENNDLKKLVVEIMISLKKMLNK